MSLRPVRTAHRHHHSLDGLWEWQPHPDSSWAPIAVPASWNDQFATGRDHLGPVTYRTELRLPPEGEHRRRVLRFDSVVQSCEVRVDGEIVGGHSGGHLPFDVDLDAAIGHGDTGPHRLEVIVDGRLSRHTIPPGGEMRSLIPSYPSVTFDFFPYSGIHRPVRVVSSPAGGIDAVRVVAGADGHLRVEADHGIDGAVLRASVSGATSLGDRNEVELSLPDVDRWSVDSPHLHALAVELVDGDEVVDCYVLDIGFRTVAVEGTAILLNGEPVWLRGFGRHEDLPISGRGINLAAAVKDLDLLAWCGGNSFRTSHYPYAEETLDLADRLGVLVISETPAVGLSFGDGEEHEAARLEGCRAATTELIARDFNHPSVIMWSLANEPHGAAHPDRAEAFFTDLYSHARPLDPTRPFTHVSVMGALDPSYDHADVLCLNRYQGWYTFNGRLADGVADLRTELEGIHERYPDRPVMFTEFGADTIEGYHDIEASMWSEEFQAEMLDAYLDLCDELPYVVGAHVWNLCDFGVVQSFLRPGSINHKGVFTRDRRPKLAAHRLRQRWGDAAPRG